MWPGELQGLGMRSRFTPNLFVRVVRSQDGCCLEAEGITP